MSEKIYRLALLGGDVAQSKSGSIHAFIFRQFGAQVAYECVSASPQDLDFAAVRLLGDFDGFNVTIPFKRDIMEFLDGVEGDALLFGAVNTVVCDTRIGYNTDGVGLLWMLQEEGVSVAGKRVLVLGAGGAGRSTAATLKGAGAQVSLYRRNQKELMETCEELGVAAAKTLSGYDIIINATGVGMHASVGVSPVESGVFDGVGVAVDLIYRPSETEFLRRAKEKGVRAINGLAMLFYQAYCADCYYLNKQPDFEQAKAFFALYRRECEGERE